MVLTDQEALVVVLQETQEDQHLNKHLHLVLEVEEVLKLKEVLLIQARQVFKLEDYFTVVKELVVLEEEQDFTVVEVGEYNLDIQAQITQLEVEVHLIMAIHK